MKENRFSLVGSDSVLVPVLGSIPFVPIEANAAFDQVLGFTRSHTLYISQIYKLRLPKSADGSNLKS